MAFTQKLIDIMIQLDQASGTNQPPNFVGTNSSSITLSGSRTSVKILNAGATSVATATVKIYGLTPSLMNQLVTLGIAFNVVPKNVITILAGDTQPLSTVFSGTIFSAYGSYEQAPDVPFTFECNSVLSQQVINAAPTSFPQPTGAAAAMQAIAQKWGLNFENNNINVTLKSAGGGGPYFKGPLRQQADQIADAANAYWGVFNGTTLAIWPKGGSRSSPPMPTLAPPPFGEMIGYPAFTNTGIVVRNLFNPQIVFGGLVEVQSTLLTGIASIQQQITAQQINNLQVGSTFTPYNFPTKGIWAVSKVDLDLDSLVPDGQWMTTAYCYNPNYSKPVPNAS